jgi:hypothetical protein
MGDKQKKKLTKKEMKALSHAKLMAGKKGGFTPPQQSSGSNIVELNAHRDKDKKAA